MLAAARAVLADAYLGHDGYDLGDAILGRLYRAMREAH